MSVKWTNEKIVQLKAVLEFARQRLELDTDGATSSVMGLTKLGDERPYLEALNESFDDLNNFIESLSMVALCAAFETELRPQIETLLVTANNAINACEGVPIKVRQMKLPTWKYYRNMEKIKSQILNENIENHYSSKLTDIMNARNFAAHTVKVKPSLNADDVAQVLQEILDIMNKP
jgi:hypothetical protein